LELKKLACVMIVVFCCSVSGNVQAQAKTKTKTVSGQPSVDSLVQANAAVWDALPYDHKVRMVSSVIEMFKEKRGVIMRKEPAFYVDEIEIARSQNPILFLRPVGAILRVMFILNRDFGDGRDPDEAIRQELGERNYRQYVNGHSAEENEKHYRQWLKDSVKRKSSRTQDTGHTTQGKIKGGR